jgi:ATP-dependent Lon protease
VLPIGGLTEKVVAAKRAGAATIIIPKANAKDLVEIPAAVKRSLTFVPVEHMDEVLEHALDHLPGAGEAPEAPRAAADRPVTRPYTRH